MNNETKRQHFIAQNEQRLNSSNPNAAPKKQMIFKFEIVNKERYQIRNISGNGVKIQNNLQFIDLYSVHIDMGMRMNFENFFNRYESKMAVSSQNLIEVLKNEKNEGMFIRFDVIKDIYAGKLLSMFRNPFSIKSTLMTLSDLLKYAPVGSVEIQAFEKVLSVDYKPQLEAICKEFNVTSDEYIQWLGCLFMLIAVCNNEDENILDGIVMNQLQPKGSHMTIWINYNHQHSCLLPDTGIITPSSEEFLIRHSVNVSKNCFIDFVSFEIGNMAKIKDENISKLYNENKYLLGKDLIKDYLEKLQINFIINDKDMLLAYNRNVIMQSKNNVYAATKKVYGVDCI